MGLNDRQQQVNNSNQQETRNLVKKAVLTLNVMILIVGILAFWLLGNPYSNSFLIAGWGLIVFLHILGWGVLGTLAKYKGRSNAWGLLILLSLIGYLAGVILLTFGPNNNYKSKGAETLGQAKQEPSFHPVQLAAATPKFCGSCGAALPAGARFCPSCATAVPQAQIRPQPASPEQPKRIKQVWWKSNIIPGVILVVALIGCSINLFHPFGLSLSFNGFNQTQNTVSTITANAFNYKGTYPAPVTITYTDKSGESRQVSAYPGQVQLIAKPTTPATTVASLVKANGGTIIAQIPSFGYYLVSISAGTENTFITSLNTDNTIEFAAPSCPLKSALGIWDLQGPNGELSVVPNLSASVGNRTYLYVPDDYANADIQCGPRSLSHGDATGFIASQNLGGTGQQINIFPPDGAHIRPSDVLSASAVALQDLTLKSTGGRAVISLSLQGNYADAQGNALSKQQYRNNELGFLWLKAAALNALAITDPDTFKQTVLVVSAGNGVGNGGKDGLDLKKEIQQLHDDFPRLFPEGKGPHMIIVGGTQANSTAIDEGFNHSSGVGDMVYAPARNVAVTNSGCTQDGTSFAAPRVSNLIAAVMADNPQRTAGEVTKAFMDAYKNKGYILPTKAEIQAALKPNQTIIQEDVNKAPFVGEWISPAPCTYYAYDNWDGEIKAVYVGNFYLSISKESDGLWGGASMDVVSYGTYPGYSGSNIIFPPMRIPSGGAPSYYKYSAPLGFNPNPYDSYIESIDGNTLTIYNKHDHGIAIYTYVANDSRMGGKDTIYVTLTYDKDNLPPMSIVEFPISDPNAIVLVRK